MRVRKDCDRNHHPVRSVGRGGDLPPAAQAARSPGRGSDSTAGRAPMPPRQIQRAGPDWNHMRALYASREIGVPDQIG